MADDPKLVVALEARLDKFERQLREAGLIAERQMRSIEEKTSSGLTGAVAKGNIIAKVIESAFKAAVESIKEAITQTVELGKAAERTGVSMENLQRIGSAAVASGLDDKTFLAGVNAVATKMNDIKHSETDLSKLLDANNIKYRDRTGAVVDANRGLELAAQLMGKASNAIDKEKIAAAFGLTAQWVDVLGQGVVKFQEMKANANVNKELGEAAEKTQLLLSIVNAIGAEFKTWGTEIAAALLPPLQSAIRLLSELSAGLASIHAGTGNFMEGPTKALADRLGRIQTTVDKLTEDAARTKLTVSGPGVKFPKTGGGGEKDALTRQIEQLSKINALAEQELQTVGMTIAKQEESRQITLLTEAAKRAGLDAETAVTEQMKEQARLAGELKQKLVEREAAWQNMLSASKELGSVLSDAMKGMVLQGQKLDEVLKNIGNRLASKAFDKLFDILFAAPAGGGGSIFTNLLGIKALAAGGPARAGRPYIVGENGPELFVPSKSGLVVPNSVTSSGRGGTAIDMGGFTIDARGASPGVSDEIVRRMRSEMPSIAVAAVAQAQRYGALR